MLDNIEFSSLNDFNYDSDSSNSTNILKSQNSTNSIVKYSNDSFQHALIVSYDKKCAKLKSFTEKNNNLFDLQNNLSQLYGFARSAGGLIKDEYRMLIWPVLAENIPCISKTKSIQLTSNKSESINQNYNEEFDITLDSDSEFESAVSTFSNDYYEIEDSQNEEVYLFFFKLIQFFF